MGDDTTVLLPFIYIYVSSSFILAIIFIASLKYKFCRWIAQASLIIGMNILLWDFISYLLPILGGSLYMAVSIEVALFCIISYVIVKSDQLKLYNTIFAISSIIFVTSLTRFIFGQSVGTKSEIVKTTNSHTIDNGFINENIDQVTNNINGNIYHIILDGYQSQVYQLFIDQDIHQLNFPLTYYKYFESNAALTWLSNSILYRGNFYNDGQSLGKWIKGSINNGLFHDIHEGGMKLYLYPHLDSDCYDLVERCTSTFSMTSDFISTKILVDLWFLKIIPSSVRSVLLDKAEKHREAGFNDWYMGFSFYDKYIWRSKRNTYQRAYLSSTKFLQMIEEEIQRPPQGQYIFFHAILPHNPMVLDESCNYIGEKNREWRELKPAFTPFLQQTACSHHLLNLLATELKRLDRFDDALIIIHSDHGYWASTPERWQAGALYDYLPIDEQNKIKIHLGKSDSKSWPSDAVQRRSSALLLIKFPGQEKTNISRLYSQTIDLAPTILQQFGIDRSNYPGIPLQNGKKGLLRKRIFFVSNKIPSNLNPRHISKYEFIENEWRFIENIVTQP